MMQILIVIESVFIVGYCFRTGRVLIVVIGTRRARGVERSIEIERERRECSVGGRFLFGIDGRGVVRIRRRLPPVVGMVWIKGVSSQ